MFGWLRRWFEPSCPVDAPTKAWIEKSMQWLADELGESSLYRRGIILPGSDFFPEVHDHSERSLRHLLDRVCHYLGVHPSAVTLRLLASPGPKHLVDEFGQPLADSISTNVEGRRHVVNLETARLHDMVGVIGTMTRVVSRLRLLSESRLHLEPDDLELWTGLSAIFQGMGIFWAATASTRPSFRGYWPGTRLRRPDAMTVPMVAYALALIAWLRYEATPHWSRHLRRDVRASFNQGIGYLFRTEDSSYLPPRLRPARSRGSNSWELD